MGVVVVASCRLHATLFVGMGVYDTVSNKNMSEMREKTNMECLEHTHVELTIIYSDILNSRNYCTCRIS